MITGKRKKIVASPNALIEYVQSNPFNACSMHLWERETLAPYVGLQCKAPAKPATIKENSSAKRPPPSSGKSRK